MNLRRFEVCCGVLWREAVTHRVGDIGLLYAPLHRKIIEATDEFFVRVLCIVERLAPPPLASLPSHRQHVG